MTNLKAIKKQNKTCSNLYSYKFPPYLTYSMNE